MGGFQYEGAQRIEANMHEENIAYGCLFCMAGKEQSVAERIQAACPDVRAITMRKIKYRLCKKRCGRKKRLFFPATSFSGSFLYRTGIDFPQAKRDPNVVHGRRLAAARCGRAVYALGFSDTMDC